MHSTGQSRNPLTRGRLLRDGVTLVVLLVLLRLLDPELSARALVLAAAVWIAGWGFWAWRDHRAWRRARSQPTSPRRPRDERDGEKGGEGQGQD